MGDAYVYSLFTAHSSPIRPIRFSLDIPSQFCTLPPIRKPRSAACEQEIRNETRNGLPKEYLRSSLVCAQHGSYSTKPLS